MDKQNLKLSTKLDIKLEDMDIEIPEYITQNLSKTLRDYQVKALKHYLLQRQKPSTNHLMFNMATGSGKTLIMAALMLECYKSGYRNFVFFVNSANILEKTKANFCDVKSAKYLFSKEIIIDNQQVHINAIESLAECKESCINIYFDTVQGLYSLFSVARENAIILDDLKAHKIVFLADEAHHLNANTKKQDEEDFKSGWEGMINACFKQNVENLMLEFTATIPKFESVIEKYSDKIVFEYALKQFYADKYSKKIYLLKYENAKVEHRFLGAIVMNAFRQCVAYKYGVAHFKPVILFKSENIAQSRENEQRFKDFVERLESQTLRDFHNTLDEKSGFLLLAFEFFALHYKRDDFYSELLFYIKESFTYRHFIVNMNSKDDENKKQMLINSLEDKDNPVRVIFAVDKLNEGWDVLNLFDIVRLSTKLGVSKTITTKEAQLIGRGARYYPFSLPLMPFVESVAEISNESAANFSAESHSAFKRKFDDCNDGEVRFLQVLESLSYHTLNDLDFIDELNKSLADAGLAFENMRKRIVLQPQQRTKDLHTKSIKVLSNKRVEKSALFSGGISNNIQNAISENIIPLLGNSTILQKEAYSDEPNRADSTNIKNLSIIQKGVFLKALNKANISFDTIKSAFESVNSKDDFIVQYLYKIVCKFHKNQAFGIDEQLQIALYVIDDIKHYLQKVRTQRQYEVLEFSANDFSLQVRELWSDKEARDARFEWLVYDKILVDSSLEWEFLEFIESNKARIEKAFEKWLVIRNEQFGELMIYDNRVDKDSYARGFAPDFVFWGKHKEGKNEVIVQLFIEAKGAHLVAYDKWKEEFLESLLRVESSGYGEKIHLKGMPFFTKIDGDRFAGAFAEALNLD